MVIRKLKPTTPGQRRKIVNDFSVLTTSKPEKSLIRPIKKTGGRNSKGRMTMRYIGGGHKRNYRIIDFKRNKEDIMAEVLTLEYDPNRSAFISLVKYEDDEKRYIIAPNYLKIGQKIMAGSKASPEVGNTLFLSEIPLGTMIHNIELLPGKGGVLVRGAGTAAQIVSKEGKYVSVKLPSGEIRMVLATCKAIIGIVSNADHQLIRSGKAGRSRWLGRRPRVRGVAMNPVDHPMGGGEGKASGGHPRSRAGLLAKGFKTRSKKKKSNRLIIEKRKKDRKSVV